MKGVKQASLWVDFKYIIWLGSQSKVNIYIFYMSPDHGASTLSGVPQSNVVFVQLG